MQNDFLPHEPPLVRELAWRRGYKDNESATTYLHPETYTFPKETPEYVSTLVEEIAKAISSGSHITVWGDFDADGQTSTAIFVESLRLCTTNIEYYIPSRSDNNHGLNYGEIGRIAERWPGSLIVTCDCGTNDLEEIAHAASLGLSVAVTDHHEATGPLPAPLVNPTTWATDSPYRGLCGAGVAYLVCRALLARMGQPRAINALLDLVAIGTIVDVAPHTPLNRALIHRGLARLYGGARPGIRAMLDLNEIRTYACDTEEIAFKIGPMLNAAGRIASANLGVELLLTKDESLAHIMAHKLKILNQERQIRMSLLETELLAYVPETPDAIIIIQGQGWPVGLIGLAAGRLANRYGKPVIIMTTFKDDLIRASCRSTEGIHLLNLLETQAHLFEQFGGHAGAAGFSIREKNIAAFTRGILSETAKLHATGDATRLVYDSAIAWSDLDLSLHNAESTIRAAEATAPHTKQNPMPLFLSKGLRIAEFKTVGESKTHAQIRLVDDNGVSHEAYWWSYDPDWEFKYAGDSVDIAYTVSRSYFAGRETVRITLEDIRCHADGD